MSSRTNPFEELERYFNRLSRQFDDSSRMWGSQPFDRLTAAVESMAVDLVEHDDEFVAIVDLPGFERDDIEIEITDHTLRIEADHDEHIETAEEAYLQKERHHESIHRSIQLPNDIDREAASATMQNGVLSITLPKLQTEDTRALEIDVQ